MSKTFWLSSVLTGSFLAKALFILAQKTYLTVEPFEYEEAAQFLVHGEGFKNHFLNTTYYAPVHPFYPLLCSAVYLMKGDHLTVLFLQTVVSTFLGFLVYQLGRKLFSPTVGLLGCFLTLFHPALWVYTTLKLHSLIFDASWFVVVLLSFLKWEESISAMRSFWTGLSGGLACLSRSTLAPFLFFATGWGIWRWRKKASPVTLGVCGTLLLLTVFLTVTPWLVRNEKRIGHPIGVVSTGGLNLWLGNNPHASGSAHLPDCRLVLNSMPTEMSQRLLSLTEWEQSEFLKEEALRFMKDHPRRTILLFWKKWIAFWWQAPQTGIKYPPFWKKAYFVYYPFVLLLAALGMRQAPLFGTANVRAASVLILVLFLIVSLTQSLFFVEGRHRWALEPILLVFSAEELCLIWGNLRNRCAGFAERSV